MDVNTGSTHTVGSSEIFDHLKSVGLLSDDQLQIGLIESRRHGEVLGKSLLKLGFVTESLLQSTELQLNGGTSIDLPSTLPDPEALSLLTRDFSWANHCVAVSLSATSLTVAVADLNNLPLHDKLKKVLGSERTLQLVRAGEREILEAIDRFYGFELSIDGILCELESGQSQQDSSLADTYHQPVVRLVDAILTDAVKHRASDIHFEPDTAFVRIRYRIDGVLRQVRSFHIDYWAALVVRIKVLAGLNIAETRAPQDGQIAMSISAASIDFRVSCMPTLHGENVVLRILDRQSGIVPLADLGLSKVVVKQLTRSMNNPQGLILVTGPTGSGKTTTLYSMLAHKSDEKINVMTLEDPVEYPMSLLRQTSVNEQIKLGFSEGIKSILRQDPDVILVGEIRDSEVAGMVVRASMTGHQVYSTLHTNSAIGAVTRLKDLGVSSALIASNVTAIVAQRLLRKSCTNCRREESIDEAIVYKSAGCEVCAGTGFKGRIAVVEVLTINEEIANLIAENASENRIFKAARAGGYSSLADEAINLVRAGVTTMQEASRVINIANSVIDSSSASGKKCNATL